MAASNWKAALDFVWQTEFDNPEQGYHVTPGDTGGGTYGGVIEATWARYDKSGTPLREATTDALAAVLRTDCWAPQCDALPSGIDLLLFNGRMASGRYPYLFQTGVGLLGDDVDGIIGPQTMRAASARCSTSSATITLIYSLVAIHHAYLVELPTWIHFGHGWTNRQLKVRTLALKLVNTTIQT